MQRWQPSSDHTGQRYCKLIILKHHETSWCYILKFETVQFFVTRVNKCIIWTYIYNFFYLLHLLGILQKRWCSGWFETVWGSSGCLPPVSYPGSISCLCQKSSGSCVYFISQQTPSWVILCIGSSGRCACMHSSNWYILQRISRLTNCEWILIQQYNIWTIQ